MKACVKIARSFVLSLLVSMLFIPGAKGQVKHSSSELHFSAENENTESSVVPPPIWEILVHDSDVRTVMESAKPPLRETPRSWFKASYVSLHGPENHDLVVKGEDQLLGANVTTFWLFLQTPKGPRLVLKIPAHDLVIKSVEWHGYKIIDAFSMTAIHTSMTSFCFDGQQYVPCRAK